MLRDNFEKVQERIARAASRSGRKPGEITLVAVTKTVPQARILEAVSLGIKNIGESRVQEALDKYQTIGQVVPVWHMIGHLQTNKVNRALEIFQVVQSVDSIRLARAIDRRAGQLKKVQNCLVEIKLEEEPAKTGLRENELEGFFRDTEGLKNITIGGIMMIAPFFNSSEDARPAFRRARKIFEGLFLEKSGSVISMGMSSDFEIAIEEGSTMVRIGSAIFGERAGKP